MLLGVDCTDTGALLYSSTAGTALGVLSVFILESHRPTAYYVDITYPQ